MHFYRTQIVIWVSKVENYSSVSIHFQEGYPIEIVQITLCSGENGSRDKWSFPNISEVERNKNELYSLVLLLNIENLRNFLVITSEKPWKYPEIIDDYHKYYSIASVSKLFITRLPRFSNSFTIFSTIFISYACLIFVSSNHCLHNCR